MLTPSLRSALLFNRSLPTPACNRAVERSSSYTYIRGRRVSPNAQSGLQVEESVHSTIPWQAFAPWFAVIGLAASLNCPYLMDLGVFFFSSLFFFLSLYFFFSLAFPGGWGALDRCFGRGEVPEGLHGQLHVQRRPGERGTHQQLRRARDEGRGLLQPGPLDGWQRRLHFLRAGRGGSVSGRCPRHCSRHSGTTPPPPAHVSRTEIVVCWGEGSSRRDG